MYNCLLCILFQSSKYYKGGFEPKMTKREASLILGIRYYSVLDALFWSFSLVIAFTVHYI